MLCYLLEELLMLKYRTVGMRNDTSFRVELGFLGLWWNGYIWTNYFSVEYRSREGAIKAVAGYKSRIKVV
jgi:hypothetical protein